MADVSVKMGVSGISQFKSEITQAQARVKTYDAALKVAEKQFRATGNAEQYMSDKTAALQGKLAAQQSAVKSAEAALKTMTENGVNQASTAYQKMQQSLLNAQAAVLDTQNDISNLGKESAEATGQTDKLAESLGGLNKKVSLEQVISGIGRVTSGLENAAKRAVQLGETLWGDIMQSAQWADDSATMAMMYGMDLDTFLRVQKLVTNGLDTSVEAILTSQSKLKKNVGGGSDSIMETLRELGVLQEQAGKYGPMQILPENSDELFWQVGQALMKLENVNEQEAKAQQLFGKSWRELVPLFSEYSSYEEYQKALEGVKVNSEEDVEALAELNDKVAELKGNFETLSNEVWAKMAPALTGAAEALNGLLERVMEYLETPEGQKALEDMGKAVEGLFADLGNIDPEKVVSSFADLFGNIVEGFEWISDNWGAVKDGITAIAGAFGLLKVSEGVLTFMKMAQGVKGLFGGGNTPTPDVTNATGGEAATGMWNSLKTTVAGSVLPALGGLTATFGTMALPPALALLVSRLVPEEKKLGSEKRVEAAEYSEADLQRLREWVELRNQLTQMENNLDNFDEQKYGETQEKVNGLADVLNTDLGKKFWDYLVANNINPNFDMMPTDFLDQMAKELEEGDPVKVPTQPELPEGAEAIMQAGLNSLQLTVPVFPSLQGTEGGEDGKHANGLPFVPFDGYHALLHKGERVVPAREITSRNFSSNLYIESMYMSSGMDADGLAAAIAARNQRVMAGFGS